MATNYTSLLGLALPTTGELVGTWGDTVNNSITQLVEDSIAGTTTQSITSGDWTLSTTGSGAANQARAAIIIPTGTPGVSRNIIAPSKSKAYVLVNESDAAVVFKAAATTGVTVATGAKALIAWNGTDFVIVSSTDISNLSGTLPVNKGGTGQTTYTDGQLLIGNTSGNTLAKATLTAGTGISVTNGAGSITVAATNNGTVTSVSGTGAVNGISLSGTVTSSGSLTLGGTLSGVNLATQVTGTLPVANGGTGVTSSTGTGSVVLSTSPVLVTPTLGTPTSGNLSSCTADGTNAIGYRNIPAVADKTSSYQLTTSDIGKVVGVGSGGSITIPNSVFAAGDAVLIFNNTANDVTITCTISTAYSSGNNTPVSSVTLVTRGVANILFLSATSCVITGSIF
jgi:hypothetical protein